MADYFDYEKNALSSVYPWLMAIHIPNTNLATAYSDKLIADTQTFEWQDGDSAEFNFLPFPFTVPSIQKTSSGSFPSITLRLFNTATVVKVIDENNGFIGNDISLYFLNANAIKTTTGTLAYNSSNYPLKFDYVINNVKIGNYINVEIGSPNYLSRNIPAARYYRDYCPVEYKGGNCWMRGRTEVSGESTSCGKTWSDCYSHWEYQSKPTDGVRFMGFPGLAKGSYVYY